MRRLSINLAGTPFINRTVPAVALAVIWGVALLLTALNVGSFFVLGRDYRTQRSVLKDQEARLSHLRASVVEKEKSLQGAGIASVTSEAQFVSEILKEKRFSWTQFLGDLERIKPYGVMFTAIVPQINPDGTVGVALTGDANPRSELLKLEQNLMTDKSFTAAQLHSEQKEASSPWIHFQISCIYLPGKGP
jgi:hypothetical protein